MRSSWAACFGHAVAASAVLRDELQNHLQITAETLIQRHDAIYQHAFKSGQYAAATKANTEISILTGHRVEKKEVGQPSEFDHLSDDELLQAIRECSVRLGLTPDAGSDTTRH